MEKSNLGKSIKRIFDGQYKYIVPIYQRNFAWRREQIEQLLQDVYEAYKSDKNGNYYIGSLVVLKRSNGDFEVIDGQQRLTTLSIISKILGINEAPRLFYDSRPEVEVFFRDFYKSGNSNIDYPQTFYLREAIRDINDAILDPNSNDDIRIQNVNKEFIEYFSNNVILVRVEIPEDTDVASYFEIMNNRGEQLKKHEILKSYMLGKIEDSKRKEFALIWDACSQMDIPIQKSFKAGDKESIGSRNNYFSDNYDEFSFSGLFNNNSALSQTDKSQQENDNVTNSIGSQNGFSINKIIGDYSITVNSLRRDEFDDEEFESDSQYKSIIDFPNFLMHVFKVMFPNKEIPLNEKYLLSIYKDLENEIKPEEFIKTLFFCRAVFDRYIVKTTVDDKDTEDGEKWALIKPKRYEKKWEYIGTFNNSNGISNEQERIVKALSMLQVSYRTRIYKKWMYEILKWFNDKKTIDVPYKEYISILDKIILSNYKELNCEQLGCDIPLSKDNSYSLGTNTPHFLFNFIDYLYWVDSKNENSIFDGKNPKELKDFEFKYWNSVEHHMAKEWAKRNNIENMDDFIDCLGNLCLISKSSNSRLSDRDVKEKVETFGKGNIGANRQVMYKMTKNSNNTYTWDEGKIREHYNELLSLLSNSKRILGLSTE